MAGDDGGTATADEGEPAGEAAVRRADLARRCARVLLSGHGAGAAARAAARLDEAVAAGDGVAAAAWCDVLRALAAAGAGPTRH